MDFFIRVIFLVFAAAFLFGRAWHSYDVRHGTITDWRDPVTTKCGRRRCKYHK